MKLSDYRHELYQNPEYREAALQLRYHFDLANSVLGARLRKGWSQNELAKRVGTKQANISRIEAGAANPTLDLIQRLCDALDLVMKWEPVEEMPHTFHAPGLAKVDEVSEARK